MKPASLVSIGCLLSESAFRRLAPRHDPAIKRYSELERQPRALGHLARLLLVRNKLGKAALVRLAHRADVADALLGGADVGEEQLEHPLVTHLERRIGFWGEPRLERGPPGLSQLVDRSGAAARRLRLTLDQALLLEPPQLGGDLAV